MINAKKSWRGKIFLFQIPRVPKSVYHCMLKAWLPLGYEVCCGLPMDYLSLHLHLQCSVGELFQGHTEPVTG